MSRTIRIVALFTSGAVLLSFGILVINQTAGVVQLADRLDPALGTVTLWTLVVAYAGLTVQCARDVDAHVIVRGLRNVADFEFGLSILLAGLEQRLAGAIIDP